MNRAVWESEETLDVDWVLRLSNAVSSLPGGTSGQVDGRVKSPQPQSRLLVIIEPCEKFNLKRGVDIGVPRGIQWGTVQPAQLSVRSRMSPSHRSPSPREYLQPILYKCEQLLHSEDPDSLEAPSPTLCRGRENNTRYSRETGRLPRVNPTKQPGRGQHRPALTIGEGGVDGGSKRTRRRLLGQSQSRSRL